MNRLKTVSLWPLDYVGPCGCIAILLPALPHPSSGRSDLDFEMPIRLSLS